MTASKLYRVESFVASKAIKAPVATETTANITLSGLQTINGVALAAGDRVLVKDQTDATENGIYDASTSAWQRSADWDGERDATNGTLVVVGRTTAVALWQMTTASDPFTPGTSSCSFTLLTGADILILFASTANGEGASLIGIEDAGGLITATDVEAALQEVAADVATNASDISTNTADIATNASDLAAFEANFMNNWKTTDLLATSTTSEVTDDDFNNYFTLVAGRMYRFEAHLSCNAAGAGGGGFRFYLGGVATSQYESFSGYAISEAGATAFDADNAGDWITIPAATIGAGDFTVYVSGFIRCAAGGSWGLEWSQATSSSDSTRVKAGSYIYLERL